MKSPALRDPGFPDDSVEEPGSESLEIHPHQFSASDVYLGLSPLDTPDDLLGAHIARHAVRLRIVHGPLRAAVLCQGVDRDIGPDEARTDHGYPDPLVPHFGPQAVEKTVQSVL